MSAEALGRVLATLQQRIDVCDEIREKWLVEAGKTHSGKQLSSTMRRIYSALDGKRWYTTALVAMQERGGRALRGSPTSSSGADALMEVIDSARAELSWEIRAYESSCGHYNQWARDYTRTLQEVIDDLEKLLKELGK